MYASRFIAVVSAIITGCSAAAIKNRWGVPRNAAVTERCQNGTVYPQITWSAHNYTWGCSPGGCSSRFNISAQEGYSPGAPGFNVVCSPIYIQQGWVPCRNPDNTLLSNDSQVFAIWTAGPDRERQYLGVSHIFQHQHDGLTWNATAGTDFIPARNMSIIFPVKTVTVFKS
ncbi:hypothetical protein EsH8_III_001282 [Colletotrichum jinshuiense]